MFLEANGLRLFLVKKATILVIICLLKTLKYLNISKMMNIVDMNKIYFRQNNGINNLL